MELEPSGQQSPAIRTRMKGVIVKALRKAKPESLSGKRFAGTKAAGGYVRLAHTGIKRIFRHEPLIFGPRLNVAKPAPSTGLEPYANAAAMIAAAMNTLSPASMRASVHGKPVTVTVPDEATAVVFRQALELSRAERPTDALIAIEIEGNEPKAS